MSYCQKRKSLAGKCGIPFEWERAYVETDSCYPIGSAPRYARFPDGREWKIRSVIRREEFGRDFFGNLCVRYDVFIGEDVKSIWWENSKWFTRKEQSEAHDKTVRR